VNNAPATLLTNKNELSFTGTKIPSDAYYGFTDGLHSISIDVTSFIGRIYIEGTLALNPTDNDWFTVSLDPINGFLEYNDETSVNGYTFRGNLMYIRARIDRDYLPGSPDLSTLGSINKILLNV
jgi:hypothetical protein